MPKLSFLYGLIICSAVACNAGGQKKPIEHPAKMQDSSGMGVKDTILPQGVTKHRIDEFLVKNNYTIAKNVTPNTALGFFDEDPIEDTAILIKSNATNKVSIGIKLSTKTNIDILKTSKDAGVVDTSEEDFDWVGTFSTIKKGTVVFDNVDANGEIVDETQIPASKKFTLNTDGLFVHQAEASGGGIIYYKNKKYCWVQQD